MSAMDPDFALLPEHMREPMRLYLHMGIHPGGFLTSVLENDLSGAVARADATNKTRLSDIVNFLQWHAPAGCWGSPQAVDWWMERHETARRLAEDREDRV